MSLEDRIEGRKDAEWWANEMATAVGLSSAQYQAAFWDAVYKLVVAKVPPVPPAREPIVPMSDQQADAFKAREIPFGKHRGDTVWGVAVDDPGYLLWLADQPDEFRHDLKRFLANPEVMRLTQPE